MNLVGKSTDEDISSGCDPLQSQNTFQAKRPSKESRSALGSFERSSSLLANTRFKVMKPKRKECAAQMPAQSKGSKVQMILDRHKEIKQRLAKEAETMYENLAKVKSMASQQRRDKNKSNMSVQPDKSSLYNFTMESGSIKQNTYEELGSSNSRISETRGLDNESLNKKYKLKNDSIKEHDFSESSSDGKSSPDESDHTNTVSISRSSGACLNLVVGKS